MKNYDGNSALDIFLNNDWRTQNDTRNLESLILLLQQGIYINDKETHENEVFAEESINYNLRKFGLTEGKSFAEVIANNSIEELIRAVNNGFDINLRDKSNITLPEAALNSREVDLLRACIKTGERNKGYTVQDISESLLVIAMNNCDVEGVKILLEAGVNPELPSHLRGVSKLITFLKQTLQKTKPQKILNAVLIKELKY